MKEDFLGLGNIFGGIDFVDKRDSEFLVEESKKNGTYKQVLDKAIFKTNKYFELHLFKIKNLRELLDLPKKNQQYRIITQQHFNTFTFILYIIEKHQKIDELDVITFNMNEGTILGLLKLLDDGTIKKLRIVVSDSVKFRMPKRVNQLKEAYEIRKKLKNFSVVFIWNHAKIATVKTGNSFYVIEGSGNFSSNAEIEQYVFENNKSIFDFHKRWITEAIFSEKKGVRMEILD